MTLRNAHNGIALKEKAATFSSIAAAEMALRAGVIAGVLMVGADVVVARNTGDAARLEAAGYVAALMVEGRCAAGRI